MLAGSGAGKSTLLRVLAGIVPQVVDAQRHGPRRGGRARRDDDPDRGPRHPGGHPHPGPDRPAVPAHGARRGRVRAGEPRGRPGADRSGRAPHARVRGRRAPGGPAHGRAVRGRGATDRARGRARGGPAGAAARRADRPAGPRGRAGGRGGGASGGRCRPGDGHGGAPARRARTAARAGARPRPGRPGALRRPDAGGAARRRPAPSRSLGTWLPLSAELAAAGVGRPRAAPGRPRSAVAVGAAACCAPVG